MELFNRQRKNNAFIAEEIRIAEDDLRSMVQRIAEQDPRWAVPKQLRTWNRSGVTLFLEEATREKFEVQTSTRKVGLRLHNVVQGLWTVFERLLKGFWKASERFLKGFSKVVWTAFKRFGKVLRKMRLRGFWNVCGRFWKVISRFLKWKVFWSFGKVLKDFWKVLECFCLGKDCLEMFLKCFCL